ncbi:MAG: endolytic transglycosylase MltG, partial [Oscillibacter sp.]|nr:endolytic transglycosylase MltG [Oscillibacter sp.]
MTERRRGDTASWNKEEVRRAQAAARPRRRRRPLRSALGYILFVLLTSAILAGVGWLLFSDLCAFNREYAEATVEITADDHMGSISRKLHDAGLIRYPWFFRLFGAVSNADEKIGIGTYSLNTDMDYRALILNMHNSSGNLNATTVKVTIPEGYTVAQTIRLMAEKGVNTEEELLEAARTARFNHDYIDNSSQDPVRL